MLSNSLRRNREFQLKVSRQKATSKRDVNETLKLSADRVQAVEENTAATNAKLSQKNLG